MGKACSKCGYGKSSFDYSHLKKYHKNWYNQKEYMKYECIDCGYKWQVEITKKG